MRAKIACCPNFSDGFLRMTLSQLNGACAEPISCSGCAVVAQTSAQSYGKLRQPPSGEKEWPGKLSKDQEEAGATVAVLVCDSLPDGIDTLGQHGSIWVATFGCAMDVALMLRMLVINAHRYEAAASNRATSAEKVFDYGLTGAFGARVDQIATTATKMMRELSREKREFELRWKRMEGQITELLQVRDAIGFDLIGVAGSNVELPPAFCAKLPGTDEADEFMLLQSLVDSPLELARTEANDFPSPSSVQARIPRGPRSKRRTRAEEGG